MSKNAVVKELVEILGGTAKCAKRMEIQPPSVSQWISGRRPVSPQRCVQFEMLLGGDSDVRKRLRPNDWHKLWPELPGADELNQEEPPATPQRRKSDVGPQQSSI